MCLMRISLAQSFAHCSQAEGHPSPGDGDGTEGASGDSDGAEGAGGDTTPFLG